jgi:probable addiction module antidote protein
MTLKTRVFDPAKYLKSAEVQQELLDEAFETGDPALILNVLGIVARARGITATAKKAGITREALHKALSPEGNPTLTTLLGATKALGYRLSLVPISAGSRVEAAE